MGKKDKKLRPYYWAVQLDRTAGESYAILVGIKIVFHDHHEPFCKGSESDNSLSIAFFALAESAHCFSSSAHFSALSLWTRQFRDGVLFSKTL
ncbi:MAG: hypothetical protein HUK21_10330 [Fibrobacteraceae bacterium]|nr:hypothetical protein [Fibrobacteraceae bacterium]